MVFGVHTATHFLMHCTCFFSAGYIALLRTVCNLVIRSGPSNLIEDEELQTLVKVAESARPTYPNVLKDEIVLTVLECKGLEFDDVLLYNFFSDSMVRRAVSHTICMYLFGGAELVDRICLSTNAKSAFVYLQCSLSVKGREEFMASCDCLC